MISKKNSNKKIELRKNGTWLVSVVSSKPSRTDQSQAEDCDVNTIMKRLERGIMPPNAERRQGQYRDLTELPDLATALNTIQIANSHFEALPAQVRDRFGNSPQAMIEFLKHEGNRAEAESLGLILKKPVPELPVSDGNKRQRVSPKISQSSTPPPPDDTNDEN